MTEGPEDQVHDLEREAEEMEEGLDKLEGDIETAQERAAEQRERANPEAAAGDWQEESTAAHQGDDATEASRSPGDDDDDGGEDGGTAVADAPVYEAERVEPGGGEGDDEDAGSGEDDARGSASLDDVPVHEAERVEPEGSGDERAEEGSDEDAEPSGGAAEEDVP